MPGDTQQRIQKKFLRNKHNGRQEIDLYMKKKKISLRKIILLLMILGCLTSAVAIILTSYSSLQLMNQNNIEDNMKMNLYQFTKESDEACYKLLRVLNQMSADGMVGSAVDKYLTQEEHYDQYVNKKNLRAQLVSLNSSSPSLLIAFYYDPYRNCELVPNYANVKISMEYKRAPVLFEATVNTFQGIHGSVFYQNICMRSQDCLCSENPRICVLSESDAGLFCISKGTLRRRNLAGLLCGGKVGI